MRVIRFTEGELTGLVISIDEFEMYFKEEELGNEYKFILKEMSVEEYENLPEWDGA